MQQGCRSPWEGRQECLGNSGVATTEPWALRRVPPRGSFFATLEARSSTTANSKMADESQSRIELEIGHVLFIDIVGYSKLLTNEQTEALQALNEAVRQSEHFRTADAERSLIRLPTGDGMALVFLHSLEAPVRCALEITETLRGRAKFALRMGVHSG